MFSRLVLNEPHASIEGLFDADKSFWDIDADFLNNVVIKWTDWHTDYLFHGLQDSRIKTVRFPYSRFIVDAERLWNDPLENIGQGIVYRNFAGYKRAISPYTERRLLNLWKSHQVQLQNQLKEGALLLDCHSFPEELSDIDICIGFNEDWSKPRKEVIEFSVNYFMDCGYKVGVNTPYSNSETPECKFRYSSLMLEVNKRIYLHHDSILLRNNNLRNETSKFMRELLTFS